MAAITINTADVFPDGTSVSAYQRNADIIDGAPLGRRTCCDGYGDERDGHVLGAGGQHGICRVRVTVTAGATAKPAFFRFFGGRPTYQSSFWQTTGRYLSSPAAWGVEFDFDGDQFDVQIQTAQNATWRLFVDGQPTGPTWTLYPHAIFFTGTVTGGTFTLTYGGQTTSAITYSTGLTAATVQAALEALSSIGAGNIKVAKISNTEFDVYFRGVAYPLTTMTSDITGLTGTTPGITISNPTGNTRYANVNFGAAARRRIRLEFAGSTVKFGGISREQTKYSVEKPSGRLGPKLVFFGDSFTIPTVTTGVPSASNTPTWDGYAHKAGKLLGYRDTEAIAQGGTGFFIAGTGSVFRARIQDVIDAQPDVFVLSGGHNDLGSGSATVQGVTDEGTYLLNAGRVARGVRGDWGDVHHHVGHQADDPVSQPYPPAQVDYVAAQHYAQSHAPGRDAASGASDDRPEPDRPVAPVGSS
jgi:lysophospholipase L1-like esterase